MTAVCSSVAVALLATAIAAQAPTLEAITQRTRDYVRDYEAQFSALVADERYDQEVRTPVFARTVGNPRGGVVLLRNARTMRSSYLLVLLGDRGFVPFRDVFEVDGKPVRDRDQRLVAMFRKPSESTLEQATRLTMESARFNISDVIRTVNVPTLALTFLHPRHSGRFSLARAGEERLRGRRTWMLDFREDERPTLVKTAGGEDLPSLGRVWVDPATGVILRTRFQAGAGEMQGTITVEFEENKPLSMWVPVRMEELYRSSTSSAVTRGTATYRNYQRVTVSTVIGAKEPGPR